MTGNTITYSSELMKNYKPVEVMAPDVAFHALQTTGGHALLFSVGGDGACYALKELGAAPPAGAAQTSPSEDDASRKAGWAKANLSSGMASSGTTAKRVAASQNRGTSNIDLALVMTGAQNDALHLCLGNSAGDTSWTTTPAWNPVPFDDAANPLSSLSVSNVMISEASDGQYIVADVLRDPASGSQAIFRYYIDPTKANGQAWNPHDLAGDIEAGSTTSCLGRPEGGEIDGIYTMGTIGGQPQLFFQPLYNAFDPTQPAPPARFVLPDGGVGSALVAINTGVDGDDSTDLFVASGQTICFFPAGQQGDGAAGQVVLNDAIFADIQSLYGRGTATEVILWGLNGAHQMFSTRCLRTEIATAGWSTALSLYEGVQQIAPYLNSANNANSFFLHTGADELKRVAQAPDSTTWKADDILLPPPDGAKVHKASSFSTRIQIADANQNPLANEAVQISALHRVGVDLNGYYTVLDTTPVTVKADASGVINIIEWVDSPRATALRVAHADGTVVAINPMGKVLANAASLNAKDKLKAARLPDNQGQPTDKPLVPDGPTDDDLDAAATAVGQLSDVYKKLPADGSTSAAPVSQASFRPATRHIVVKTIHSVQAGKGQPITLTTFDIGIPGLGTIESWGGDLLKSLEHATDYMVSIVQDAADDAWHFVAHIAGKVYSFALDAAEKVIGAVVAIYNAIKTAIEDLLAWLEFLLEWPDFIRTKNACKQLLKLALSEPLGDLKGAFNGIMTSARNGVGDLTGVKDTDHWSGGVDNSSQAMRYATTFIDVSAGFTSPAMFVYRHFIDNFMGTHGDGGAVGGPDLDDLLAKAVAAAENESDVLVSAVKQMFGLVAKIDFTADSLENILKQFVGIIADTFLNSGEVVVDALIDLLAGLASDVYDELDKPIWIPVVSDILVDVFGDSASFSWLDFILLIGAIPAALICKANTGSMPFASDDKVTTNIMNANNMAELRDNFAAERPQAMVQSKALFIDRPTGATQSILDYLHMDIGDADRQTLFIVCHAVAGVGAMVAGLLVLIPNDDTGPNISRAVVVCGVVSGLAAFVTSIFAPTNPIQNTTVSLMASAASTVTVISKARYGIGAFRETDQGKAKELRDMGATIDCVMALIGMFPSCYHFYELSNEPASSGRTEAILDETASICSAFGRIAQDGAWLDEDPETKEVLAATAAILMLVYSALEFSSGAIETA